MRLSTQIITGHTFLVAFLVTLTAFGITLVERMTHTNQLIAEKLLTLTGAAHEMQVLLLRHELEKRGGPKLPRGAKESFEELSRKATLAAAPGKEEVLASTIARSWAAAFDGASPADETAGLAGELFGWSADVLRNATDHSARMGRGGVGLIAVIAVLGLVVTLYFGYWLSKSVTQPLERMARALDAVTAGDLNRRFTEVGAAGAVTEIAASLNQVVDRLQRSEAMPRTDLLLAREALAKLLESDERPGGVLAGGDRLVASNEKARKLVLDRGSPFHRLAAEAREKEVAAVETVPLDGPGGERLGEIVRISSTDAG